MMASDLRLMAVLAHPDDESLGLGGALARYAAEGVETTLVTATRGERGRLGTERPGAAVLAPIRERELLAAAAVLRLRAVHFLDYLDGELADADHHEATTKIVALLRTVRPHVVVTFGPEGAYGHPDHVAISQLTAAAVVAAADPSFTGRDGAGTLPADPWRVAKLYWMATTSSEWAAFQEAFGEIAISVDGAPRKAAPWPDWAVTTVVDTAAHSATVWRAVRCHESQVNGHGRLEKLSAPFRESLWRSQSFYRAFSLVNGGRGLETDLFEGLR